MLKWTNNPPEKDGWYWMRYKSPFNCPGEKQTNIVWVCFIGDRGCAFGAEDKELQDPETEWAGPIPEPTESAHD